MSVKRSAYIASARQLFSGQRSGRGDTIVEVLLAIAVTSAVLGGAYVSASRSFNNTRRSQERGEASKYVEGQLERLKQAVKNDPAFFTLPAGNTYCLDDALNRHPVTDAECRVGPSGRYQLTIQRNGNSFAASAQWDRFGGGTSTSSAKEEVRIVYRLYP